MVNKKIQLQDDGINLYPLAMLNGIDTNNIIANLPVPTNSYVVPQDCIAIFRSAATDRVFKIDDVVIVSEATTSPLAYTYIPLKRGQIFSITGTASSGLAILYGIKR